MNCLLLLAPLMAAVGPIPDEAVKVSAHLTADALEVGGEYEFVVDVEIAEGVSTSEAGVPAPILQIKVPKSVKLLGKELTTYKELSKNEFLEEPYERLLKELPATVKFKVVRRPKSKDHFSMNVLAYLAGGSKGSGFFRRRLELAVSPGATATMADPTETDWGKTKTLQIGDKAKKFRLTGADGETVSLKDFKGKKNVIVTTYRAFW